MLRWNRHSRDLYYYLSGRGALCLKQLGKVAAKKGPPNPWHVVYFQIDNFSIITTLYGHSFIKQIYPKLLVEIGALDHLLALDIFPDLGGMIIFSGEIALEEAISQLRKVVQDFGFRHAPKALFMTASFASVEVLLEEILKHPEVVADKLIVAHNYLKQYLNHDHVSYETINKQLDFVHHEMRQANRLQIAIADKKLKLAFQPIIDSLTGETAWYECLMRLYDYQGQLRSVGPLVPVAEKYGFIDRVDDFVLELVMQSAEQHPGAQFSFNISGLCVLNSRWLKRVTKLFSDRPDLANRIIIEITENALLSDLGKAAYFVVSLQQLGFQVALDDFGAGHTSFRQVKSLSVDIIKIDGSLVRDMVSNANNRLMVKVIIDMCQSMNIKCVAEFVESGEVVKMLMAMKADYMQGNFLSAPLNELMTDNNRLPPHEKGLDN